MRNKFSKYIALWMVAALPLASCENFLEKVNPNEMSTDSFWKDNNDLEMGLVAVYNSFKNQNITSIQAESARSDLAYPGFGRPNPNNPFAQYYNQVFNDASQVPNQKWDALYKGIFRANQVIKAYDEVAPTLTTEEQQATAMEILAQARFLRGMFYFYLYNSFNNGSVIIYEEVPQNEEDFYAPLQSASAVKEFFMDDLMFGYENLPVSWSEDYNGKVTKGAAAAILGKVHLYAEEFAQAEVYFEDVINNYGYALAAHINDNFSEAGEFNPESILEVNYSLDYKSEVTLWDEEQSSTNLNFAFSPVGGFRAIIPSLWITNAYRNDPVDVNDTRNWIENEDGNLVLRKFSIRTSSSIALADDDYSTYYGYHPGESARFNNKEYAYYRKHTNWETVTNEKDIQPTQRSGINVRLIRLADIFLMYAECKIMTGDLDAAMRYINKVRHRSALQLIGRSTSSEYPSASHDEVDYSPQMLLDHLMYIERPLELSVEGHAIRYFDLRRWGITKSRFEELSQEVYTTLPYTFIDSEGKSVTRFSAQLMKMGDGEVVPPGSPTLQDFQEAVLNYNDAVHAYWPIPNSEITANPNIN